MQNTEARVRHVDYTFQAVRIDPTNQECLEAAKSVKDAAWLDKPPTHIEGTLAAMLIKCALKTNMALVSCKYEIGVSVVGDFDELVDAVSLFDSKGYEACVLEFQNRNLSMHRALNPDYTIDEFATLLLSLAIPFVKAAPTELFILLDGPNETTSKFWRITEIAPDSEKTTQG